MKLIRGSYRFAKGTCTVIGALAVIGVAGKVYYVSKQIAEFEEHANFILHLPLDVPYQDNKDERSLVSQSLPYVGDNPVSLQELSSLIKRAEQDPKIKGIIARVGSSIPLAHVQELHYALESYKSSGKPYWCYIEKNVDDEAYYLASPFQKISIQPASVFALTGVSSNTPFFKNLLEKWKIKIETIRSSDHKTGPNVLLETHFTPEHREAVQGIISSVFDQRNRSILQHRKLATSDLEKVYNSPICTPEEAKQLNMIDGVEHYSNTLQKFKEHVADINQIPIDQINYLSLKKYIKYVKRNKLIDIDIGQPFGTPTAKRVIALVYLNGNIGPAQGLTSLPIVKTLRDLENNKCVSGVLLRINSPGGDVTTSDTIYNSIRSLAQKKPVVASMGSVAASGGYQLALGANKIVALPGTVTGSIGVFMVRPYFREFLEQFGVDVDTSKTNGQSEVNQFLDPLNSHQKTQMEQYVKWVFDRFVTLVAERRGLEKQNVLELSKGGKVYSGENAVKVGLVDEIGGYSKAVEVLVAEMDKEAQHDQICIEVYPKVDWLQSLGVVDHDPFCENDEKKNWPGNVFEGLVKLNSLFDLWNKFTGKNKKAEIRSELDIFD